MISHWSNKTKRKTRPYTWIPSFPFYSISYRFPLTFFSCSLYPQPPPFLAVTTESYHYSYTHNTTSLTRDQRVLPWQKCRYNIKKTITITLITSFALTLTLTLTLHNTHITASLAKFPTTNTKSTTWTKAQLHASNPMPPNVNTAFASPFSSSYSASYSSFSGWPTTLPSRASRWPAPPSTASTPPRRHSCQSPCSSTWS